MKQAEQNAKQADEAAKSLNRRLTDSGKAGSPDVNGIRGFPNHNVNGDLHHG